MTGFSGFTNRREFLKATAAGIALTGLPASAYAQAMATPVSLEEYQREYFNEAEWVFIMAAVARLIPSEGDGPGAIETRVPVYIDRQMVDDYGRASNWYMTGPHVADADPLRGWQSPLTPAEIYRQAIPVFEVWCEERYGGAFAGLEPAQQDEALTALQKNEVGLAPELRDFFSILLQNTKEGYFVDPMYGGNYQMQSWVYIGFPGARASYREWATRHNTPYPLGPVSIKGERA